ncbi:hypothetical protein ACIPL1_16745 [Pseudomonas sp. NPDC090202]|uniref:hypothetical protein n=1 Tax=unclassified Pseudomonas TaxID=196821 RepID=UPI003802E25F
MSRSYRRRFEKTFPRILERAGRHCGLCGAQFEYNASVFAGFSREDRVVLTGECCRPVLFSVHATGFYPSCNGLPIQMQHVQLELQLGSWVPADESAEEKSAERTDHLIRFDTSSPASMHSVETAPWKADDTTWFMENPTRAHRLRPAYDEELTALTVPITPGLPEGHGWEMLVRHVGKGRCIRLAFCRATQAVIPDLEEVIQGIFEAVSRTGASGFIQAEDVVEIINRHGLAVESDGVRQTC